MIYCRSCVVRLVVTYYFSGANTCYIQVGIIFVQVATIPSYFVIIISVIYVTSIIILKSIRVQLTPGSCA